MIALAGCGSDNTTVKQRFVGQANAICRRGNNAGQAINSAIAEAQRGSNPDEVFRRLAVLTSKGADTFLPYVDELDALTPPGADREKVKGWIAGQRRQLFLLHTLSAALRAHDQKQIARLSERIDALTQANNAFASRYGMADCAK